MDKTKTTHKKATPPAQAREKNAPHLFQKENYQWMLAGIIVMAIGFFFDGRR